MASDSKKKDLRVVIVGGGVAGLALANMLERFDIDYVLLEAYRDIAPQVGASIVMMANGLRILDQLGIYDSLAKLPCDPVTIMYQRDEHGKILKRKGVLEDPFGGLRCR
jgi:2-polyprenyl-6-methoxyphenol hydroxylase-like FAD-dependent oxidoreductase